MPYRFYYWPTIQGRGEFVRLALEQAGAEYVDVARENKAGHADEVTRLLNGDGIPHPPFALPALRDGDTVVAQTAAILLYLGPRHGLAPDSEGGRLWAQQIQLTIADLVSEAHDTHHPVANGLYYEDQRAEAARTAEGFRRERLPKYLDWLERILAKSPADAWLADAKPGYVDLSVFQVVEGLRYAFPRAAAAALEQTPRVAELAERVRALPRIAAYLASRRRIPFNEQGIFRRYPELDEAR